MTTPSSSPCYRVLIVEDEFLIAEGISRQLRKRGHLVVGKAISYEEALSIYYREQPDIALIDIRLNGQKTGIDLAHQLSQEPFPIPYIYLTSQSDPATVDLAKETLPSGFLSKPIQMESMMSMIAITMHNHRVRSAKDTVTVRDGRTSHVLWLNDILYLQADHVYVHLHLSQRAPLVLRSALSELIDQIGSSVIQTHRSYAVNPERVTRFETENLYIGDVEIPVSRSRRKTVADRLQSQ